MGPLLPALLLTLAPGSHPDSASRTRLEVGSGEVGMEQDLQVLSLLEVLPELDLDGDGWLDADEVAAGHDAVRTYVAAHYVVERGRAGDPEGWEPLTLREPGSGDGLALLPPDPSAFLPTPDTVRLRAVWRPHASPGAAGRELDRDRLRVTLDLFLDTSPGHLDQVEVRWPDARPERALLSAGEPRWVARRGPSLWRAALGRGARAGLLGVTGLLWFLLGIGSRRPRRALALGLVGLGLGTAAALRGWAAGLGLEQALGSLAVAVGAAYLGADVALAPGPRGRGLEALVLGVAAGLALAGHPDLEPTELVGDAPRLAFLIAGAGLPLGVAAALLVLAGRRAHRASEVPGEESGDERRALGAPGGRAVPGPSTSEVPPPRPSRRGRVTAAVAGTLALGVFLARALGVLGAGL